MMHIHPAIQPYSRHRSEQVQCSRTLAGAASMVTSSTWIAGGKRIVGAPVDAQVPSRRHPRALRTPGGSCYLGLKSWRPCEQPCCSSTSPQTA